MNLTALIPQIGDILDKFISTPEERQEIELKLKEIDVRELEARFGAIKAWQSNSSLFVSGAIPSMLWLVVAVTAFNYILAPLLGAVGLHVVTLELPEAYYSLAGTVVLGLFGKKAWDSTEINGASWTKKAKVYDAPKSEETPKNEETPKGKKAKKQARQKKQTLQEDASAEVFESTAPQEEADSAESERKPVSEMTQEEVDTRFAELAAEYGIAG